MSNTTTDAVREALPPLPDQYEAAAHMFPCDLDDFKTGETFHEAVSIPCGSPTQGRTVPLWTSDQMREYALAATASTQAEVDRFEGLYQRTAVEAENLRAEVQRLRGALTRSAELLSGMADGMREVVSEQGDGSSAPSKQEGQPANPTTSLKDHQIAQTVNALATLARDYGQTQQLRERISQLIVPILKGEGFPRSVVNAYAMPQKQEGQS